MYFGARVAGSAHLWRQRFPDGKPEQMTFGPYEEEGVAVAPDGRSLVTSVGTRRSTIWLHDNTGERPVSSEGYALTPRLSNDSKRLFYLFARDLSLGGEIQLRQLGSVVGRTTLARPRFGQVGHTAAGHVGHRFRYIAG